MDEDPRPPSALPLPMGSGYQKCFSLSENAQLRSFVKAWEQLAWYSLQAFGIFLLGRYWGYSNIDAFQLLSTTAGLTYIPHHLKNYSGPSYFGDWRSWLLSGFFITQGYIFLGTVDQNLFFVGLGFCVIGNRCLAALKPSPEQNTRVRHILCCILLNLCGLLISFSVPRTWDLSGLTILAYVSVFSLFFWIAFREQTGSARHRMIISMLLIAIAIVFFGFFYQMPTTSTLFVDLKVNDGYASLNAYWIVLLSPVLTRIYYAIAARPMDSSIPWKCGVGLLLVALSFWVVPLAIYEQGVPGTLNGSWIFLNYFLWGTGEVLFSALGLIMLCQWFPRQWMLLAITIWYLTPSLGSSAINWIATITPAPMSLSDPLQTLSLYQHALTCYGLGTALIALVLFLCVPIFNRLSAPSKK